MLPNAWPAIVFGPGHMVEKWKAEIPKVVPGAKGFIARSVADVTKFVRDWRPGDKWVLIMGYEMAKMGAGPVAIGNVPGCRRIRSFPATDEHGNVLSVRHKLRPCCPKCGNFVTLRGDDQAVKCSAVMRKITRPDGTTKDILCNEPLYQKTRYHRWQLADLTLKQFSGFFKTLICDEVHKAKGKDTDIARAFHQLTMATRYTINLTGTLSRWPFDEIASVTPLALDITQADLGADWRATSTLTLGATLGLRAVGEGVESSAQAAALTRLGCSLHQGFHLARPMSAAAASELLGRPTVRRSA